MGRYSCYNAFNTNFERGFKSVVVIDYTLFFFVFVFFIKNVYNKMSLKNPKTLTKC